MTQNSYFLPPPPRPNLSFFEVESKFSLWECRRTPQTRYGNDDDDADADDDGDGDDDDDDYVDEDGDDDADDVTNDGEGRQSDIGGVDLALDQDNHQSLPEPSS